MMNEAYQSNYDHLADELRWLDLLIRLRVAAFRHGLWTAQEAALLGRAVISHQEIDHMLCQDESAEGEPPELAQGRAEAATLRGEIETRIEHSLEAGIPLALPQLARLFALSRFEVQAVVICLAPELRRKYDKLYAYLQDDITRKKPSVDLILDLLCESEGERWTARKWLSGQAPLLQAGILRRVDDPQSPSGSSGLAQFLQLDQRVLNYLLGDNRIDERLAGLVRLCASTPDAHDAFVEPAIETELLNLIHHHLPGGRGGDRAELALHLHGPVGVCKRDVALGICAQLNRPLLCLDLEHLLVHEVDHDAAARLAFREGVLLQAALYLEHADVLLREDARSRALVKSLSGALAEYGCLTFLAGEEPWPPGGTLEHVVFHSVHLPLPDVPLREAAWERALHRLEPAAKAAWARPLARQFRLTPGQIRDAVAAAENRCAMQRPLSETPGKLTLADLYAACRAQSNQKLTKLAVKIEPRYGWGDIVLPQDRIVQLEEICDQVRHRYRVLGEWGFERKLSHGKGLSVLFSGPPGTGKTMAAEVIAGELGLDLYKVDLSGVVSKYIGETEKNLARIFAEAESSNAILFFDEADALFGKRTRVSDAHDRYANVETSYLLQRMEEYEGMVILVTNLRENMDAAFTRRIRFVVEFPFPDGPSRERIWRTHFPRQTPVGEDVDCAWLADEFQITGGSIRNIVLNAAFLAAADGGTIQMAHLLHGTRREFEKTGKLWNDQHLPPTSGQETRVA